MTGYGRGIAERAGFRLIVELTSVNRRQLDVAANLPRELAEHEGTVRKIVGAAVTRGRMNVKIALERTEGSGRTVVADAGLMADYLAGLTELMGRMPNLGVAEIVRLPGVLELREAEAPYESIEEAITEALGKALSAWDLMRTGEGEHLKSDAGERLKVIEASIDAMEAISGSVVELYRKQLHARLVQAGIPVDLSDERIVREIGLFADRCDTCEERVRLRSHLAKFRQLMADTVPPGRAMDFLLQEMNREANTIGSKANDATIAQHVVIVKTELEKIREQVQNVE